VTVQLAIARLAHNAQLSTSEQNALLDVCAGPRRYEPRRELLREGVRAPAAFLLINGVAARFVSNPDGRAQCVAYLLSGDLCGKRSFLSLPMDHSVRTLTSVDAVQIPRDALDRLSSSFPNLPKAIHRLSAIEAAVSRQWLLNVGHRSSLAALAHLFCELFSRLEVAGETIQNTCRLPFTQADLADALAITPVHLNRTLMKLRKSGLAVLQRGQLSILDAEGLRAAAKFDPLYLNGLDAQSPQLSLATAPRADDRNAIALRRGEPPPSQPLIV
jgi:CRP-like cAMP-binding protein